MKLRIESHSLTGKLHVFTCIMHQIIIPILDLLYTNRYFTDTGEQVGFTARPVIGGLYAKILLEDSKKNVSLIV